MRVQKASSGTCEKLSCSEQAHTAAQVDAHVGDSEVKFCARVLLIG